MNATAGATTFNTYRSLSQRLNTLQCLAHPKWNTNSISLLSVAKAFIFSKINYGLQFYGYAPKSQLNKIDIIINTSLRISIGILRSTPVSNLRYESNMRSLGVQIDILSSKLLYPLTYGENNPLIRTAKNIKRSKRNPKVASTLHRILLNTDFHDFPHYITLKISKQPPHVTS